MKEYLKMSDYFCGALDGDDVYGIAIHAGHETQCAVAHAINSHDELVEMNKELLAALNEARRAIGEHFAPNDCYTTGPMTGDHFRDLIQCPACSFIAMYDDAISKAKGGAA